MAGALAVLEAARNVACVGGEPLGITDCLNFGNPEKPEVGWELAEAIEGIAQACEALGVPVVSGNVSLYNDTNGRSIPPTPIVGCVGLVPDVRLTPRGWQAGDKLFLASAGQRSLAGSEYQARYGTTSGRPPSSTSKPRQHWWVSSRCCAALFTRPRRLRRRPRRRARRGGALVGRRGGARPPRRCSRHLRRGRRPGDPRDVARGSAPHRARRSRGASDGHRRGRYPARRQRRRVTALLGKGRKLAMCGVFGVRSEARDVARLSYFGLFALQHRGQESAGIAVSDGAGSRRCARWASSPRSSTRTTFRHLPGHIAIGHTRYSTTGSSAQGERAASFASKALTDRSRWVTTATCQRRDRCATTSRSTASARDRRPTPSDRRAARLRRPAPVAGARLDATMRRLAGAYCLVALRRGFAYRHARPTTAFARSASASSRQRLGHRLRDLRARPPRRRLRARSGARRGRRRRRDGCTPPRRCRAAARRPLHLRVHLLRPPRQHLAGNELLHPLRVRMGQRAGPASARRSRHRHRRPGLRHAAAIGYSQSLGHPLRRGAVKNRYVGRTFIQPDQRMREQGVQLKFNPMRAAHRGKRVVVVDDSIVRGTRRASSSQMLRKAGAKEVHMRICAPPILSPCFSASTWRRGPASRRHPSVEQIREHVGATRLRYLSLEGMQGGDVPARGCGLPRLLHARVPNARAGAPEPGQAALRRRARRGPSGRPGRAKPGLRLGEVEYHSVSSAQRPSGEAEDIEVLELLPSAYVVRPTAIARSPSTTSGR